MIGNERKPHIGIFGRRNYGKSALVNYLTGQSIAIVSPMAGTTTDPVRKTMEISGIGPVVWIDTAGLDDEGDVGRMRIERSLEVLDQVDLALILFTHNIFDSEEVSLVERCRQRNIPYLLIYSQSDLSRPDDVLLQTLEADYHTSVFVLSIKNEQLREGLIQQIRHLLPETAYHHASLLGDVVSAGQQVVLVTPIDSSAPEGRMILPQVQVLRDLLDIHACASVCQPDELLSTLQSLRESPHLVITDSQAFHHVREVLDEYQLSTLNSQFSIYLTSFSIVLARAKGLFEDYAQGTRAIGQLRDGDRVLMLESCTHNVTCEDIGRVKLPQRLMQYTGKQLRCETVAGLSSLPHRLSDYALVIQCGGCVVTPRQLRSRLQPVLDAGIPVSNYGMALAYVSGIFQRAMQIFQQHPQATR